MDCGDSSPRLFGLAILEKQLFPAIAGIFITREAYFHAFACRKFENENHLSPIQGHLISSSNCNKSTLVFFMIFKVSWKFFGEYFEDDKRETFSIPKMASFLINISL